MYHDFHKSARLFSTFRDNFTQDNKTLIIGHLKKLEQLTHYWTFYFRKTFNQNILERNMHTNKIPFPLPAYATIAVPLQKLFFQQKKIKSLIMSVLSCVKFS